MNKINLLSPLLSSRIAAGEVIERPESVLREFLDNAIDAGSSEITISIEGGGIDSISVSDNGGGIFKEDLEIIASRHATSKIKEDDDLYRIKTLGFRGEALYSIASVSELTIKSLDSNTGRTNSVTIDNGIRKEMVTSSPIKGTTVTARNLFGEIPARRSFLKRPQTEAQMCRNLVISKALAYPDISFKFYSDGALKLNYEKASSLKERVMMLYRPMGIQDADVLHLLGHDEEYSIDIICTSGAAKRSDRKEIRIYVNGRAVEEYSLVQAVTFGYGELLPGGSFPYASVFIKDNPELVDFNIHPAKKEVKLRNHAQIHHAIVLLIQNGVARRIPEIKAVQNEFEFTQDADKADQERFFKTFSSTHDSFARKDPVQRLSSAKTAYSFNTETRPADDSWILKAKELSRLKKEEKKEAFSEEKEEEDKDWKYIGQAFNLFLIVQKGEDLYFIDQHAAHERMIYDELLSQTTVQKLLIPIRLEVEKDIDEFLTSYSYIYTKLGIMIAKTADGYWEISALPAVARQIEAQVVNYISTNAGDEKELETGLFAIIACKAAIKAGDEIDRYSAEALIKKVFEMEQPACPHGRTFLIKLNEKELRGMVGRTK